MGGVCDTSINLCGELVSHSGFYYFLEQTVIPEQGSLEVVELVTL